jgi:hypothetical protein
MKLNYDSSVILGTTISTLALENLGKNNGSWAHGANHWLVKLCNPLPLKKKLLQPLMESSFHNPPASPHLSNLKYNTNLTW